MLIWDEIKKAVRLFVSARVYILSHHPTCDRFQDDVYRIGKRRLCVGCFTAYPIALAILILWLFGMISMPYQRYFLIGFSFGILQFFSLTRLSDRKIGKITIKIFLGIGIGFFTIGVFSLPMHIFLRLLLFWIFVNLAGLFSFFRMKKFKRICVECEYGDNMGTCPGFEKEL